MIYNFNSESPVGVMDSGMGGISTLKALVSELPYENYIYFGDDKNAPYGQKTVDEVRRLSENVLLNLLSQNVKAVVIGCNTATGAAAAYLRKKYPEIPIIGAEPAIKPAVRYKKNSKILVMATYVTINSEKYRMLTESFENEAEIISLPCSGLVELVEKGKVSGAEVDDALHKLLDDYIGKIDSIVLGCTHYPFLSASISKIVGDNVNLFDGNHGIAAETRHRLCECGMLSSRAEKGNIKFETSSGDPNTIEIAHKLMNL